jgi:drug/metabolite transporter (DMT)-like permease
MLAPVLGLLFNALVWGLSWLPFRWLYEHYGLHSLWTTAGIYGLAALLFALIWRNACVEVLRFPALWGLALASGLTNACFNWGITVGDVVRVVLLFYLMPVWAVLLARWLLGENITAYTLLRLMVGIVGAVFVLWPNESSSNVWAAWQNDLHFSDGLGLLGGFFFALNNVLLKRQAASSDQARALSMFIGGAGVTMILGIGLVQAQWINAIPVWQFSWGFAVVGLSLMFMAANWALQFSAIRLPANVTAVIMLSEVFFATVSSVWAGQSAWSWMTAVGAGFIVISAGLSVMDPKYRSTST